MFDIERVRQDFPALQQTVHGKPLVYLDNGATAQKPQAVINAVQQYYAHDNANVHRGIHELSERASAQYESVREQVRGFINAQQPEEIIFVKGTTEGINLVAHSFGQRFKAGDEIILSLMEHHANIVPWQQVAERTGAVIKVIPLNETGELDMAAYQALFSEKTVFVSVTHTSNVLGTVNPVKEMAKIAHQHNVPILLDGAQSIVHEAIDVQDLACDFFVFSAHKLYGPTGVGVLYGKANLLECMPPYQTGGGMIEHVSFAKTTYAQLPQKFEPGTPNIAGVIGLGAALTYLSALGMKAIAAYEYDLQHYALQALTKFPGLTLMGEAEHRVPVFSFVLADVHAQDLAQLINLSGVAVRCGHHCAMPLLDSLGFAACARASFALYNTRSEVDALVEAMAKAQAMLK